MDSHERKKVGVITKYANETFTVGDWTALGQMTGELKLIQGHPRLFRALSFGDEDYSGCAAEVLDQIFEKSPDKIDEVIDQFDIGVWYEQKDPAKYNKVFLRARVPTPDFWRDGYLRVFVSHLSSQKEVVTSLKHALGDWGMSAFIAHEDIQPSREWQKEIEIALETMDVMVAVLHPGFKESDWCAQEVGYAMGRRVDVIPLRAGLDPFGLFGKYQGVQAKAKYPSKIAEQIAGHLLKTTKHRRALLVGVSKAMASAASGQKAGRMRTLDSWGILSDPEMKDVLESISVSDSERLQLSGIVARVKAFAVKEIPPQDADIPF